MVTSARPDNGAQMKNAKPSSRHSIAMNMKTARTLGDWSQEDLGLKSGLKRTYIGALERGEINPGVDNLDRIAKAIGVPAHVLLLQPTDAYSYIFVVLKEKGDRP
jgi:transcriptional regulator with XRE-family HTH domain